MNVRACFHRTRAGTIATVLMLGLLAGCAQDETTGPDQRLPPEGAGKLENLQSDLDAVHAAVVTHYADGYVWGYSPTSASYNAGTSGYAFNRAGKAITITRTGTGLYKVRFAGLSAVLGGKSTVHVTGYSNGDAYCKPVSQKLSSDVIQIKCFDASTGSPVDAYYTVYVTRNYAHLAFAFANLPTGNNYAPPPGSASYNPSGAIRVFRSGVGVYHVVFKGFGNKLSRNGGDAQVNAIGSGAQHCKVGGWGCSPDLSITVVCYARTGEAKDVKFNILFITPKPHLAFAWADQPSASGYTPTTYYSSNSAGGQFTSPGAAWARMWSRSTTSIPVCWMAGMCR